MAYDEALASRIRDLLIGRAGVSEKHMFGGIAFLLDGKMFCGIAKNELMVRVGPERHPSALARAHVRPMDFTGRPMVGYVYVGREGIKTARALGQWIEWSTDFVSTVVAKPRREAKARAAAPSKAPSSPKKTKSAATPRTAGAKKTPAKKKAPAPTTAQARARR